MGASWVRKNILQRYPNAPLAVYAVWVSKLGSTRSDIDPKLFADERVASYWDPDEVVSAAFADDLGFYTWDVYALYDRSGALVGVGAPVISDSERLGRRVAALVQG